MHRFTGLTKEGGEPLSPLSLYFAWYNFNMPHKSHKDLSLEMTAGLVSVAMDMSDIVMLIKQCEGPPKKRGPYKAQVRNADCQGRRDLIRSPA